MHLVVRPLILSEAESNLIVIETSLHDNKVISNRKVARFAVRSPLLSLLFKCLATKHTTVKWTITGSCPSLQLSSRGQLISYKNVKKRKQQQQQQQQLTNHEQLTNKWKKKKKGKKKLLQF